MPVLNWIGKNKVVDHDKELPFRVLKKNEKFSVGEDSENLLIQGDNLEALKARIADKLVWDQLAEFMTPKDVLRKQVERFTEKSKKDSKNSNTSVERLNEELYKIKKEEDRYIRLVAK